MRILEYIAQESDLRNIKQRIRREITRLERKLLYKYPKETRNDMKIDLKELKEFLAEITKKRPLLTKREYNRDMKLPIEDY